VHFFNHIIHANKCFTYLLTYHLYIRTQCLGNEIVQWALSTNLWTSCPKFDSEFLKKVTNQCNKTVLSKHSNDNTVTLYDDMDDMDTDGSGSEWNLNIVRNFYNVKQITWYFTDYFTNAFQLHQDIAIQPMGDLHSI